MKKLQSWLNANIFLLLLATTNPPADGQQNTIMAQGKMKYHLLILPMLTSTPHSCSFSSRKATSWDSEVQLTESNTAIKSIDDLALCAWK